MALAIGSLSVMAGGISDVHRNLLDSMNESQLQIYQEVKSSRQRVFMYGVVLALSLSLLYYAIMGERDMGTICNALLVFICTLYLFYYIYPKPTMLTSLDKEQLPEWWGVYRSMQVKFYLAIALSLISMAIRMFRK